MVEQCNVGHKESWIRVWVGVIFDLIAVFAPVATGIKVIFVLIAAFGVGTGLLKFCPINRALGISTCKKVEDKDKTSLKHV